MYSAPELLLVGAASNLVLDTSTTPGRKPCSIDEDVAPVGTWEVTEEEW